MKQWRIGKFYVASFFSKPDGDGALVEIAAAQAGCAILECRHVGYEARYEIVAVHPDFDLIDAGDTPPIYDAELQRTDDGSVWRYRFVRRPS